MKLSEMKQLLSERGIQLTKSLGQNFLHDGNQLRRIVALAELETSDKVLEVGPGLGPLTELLVSRADEVLAIEKDRRLFEVLQSRFAGAANLTLIHDDALEWLQHHRRNWHEWKLVANLPYSVASPILVELARAPVPPKRLVATLQLEVARRLIAQPREEEYGLLTLLIQPSYESSDFFKIPASCFFPKPDVDSACIVLSRRAAALLSEKEALVFSLLVKRAFSQRRKMMFKLLTSEWPPEEVSAAFERIGLSPEVRAEAVNLEQFVHLAKSVCHSRNC